MLSVWWQRENGAEAGGVGRMGLCQAHPSALIRWWGEEDAIGACRGRSQIYASQGHWSKVMASGQATAEVEAQLGVTCLCWEHAILSLVCFHDLHVGKLENEIGSRGNMTVFFSCFFFSLKLILLLCFLPHAIIIYNFIFYHIACPNNHDVFPHVILLLF